MYTQNYLTDVAEGMEVFDKDGIRIGTVKALRFGEGTIKTSKTDIVTISESIAEVLGENRALPTILYARLYEEGFVCVNRGFLRRDVLVFPNQIDAIGEDAIYLTLGQAELLKC